MSRPTVLLLHAFPLDARMWDGIRPDLTAAGHEIVAPDLPGPEPEPGLPAWARRVLDLVEGPFVPVGCSLGGYLAFELWRQAAARIPALVLADTRATPDSPEQREARDDTIRVLQDAGRERLWEGLEPKLFGPGADPAVVAQAREIALDQPVSGLVATLETLRDRPDSRPTLPAIDAPVLVLVGEEDELTPPTDAEAMAAALPRARLVTIPAAGHLAPLERPREVAGALLPFLGEAT